MLSDCRTFDRSHQILSLLCRANHFPILMFARWLLLLPLTVALFFRLISLLIRDFLRELTDKKPSGADMNDEWGKKKSRVYSTSRAVGKGPRHMRDIFRGRDKKSGVKTDLVTSVCVGAHLFFLWQGRWKAKRETLSGWPGFSGWWRKDFYVDLILGI